MSEASNVYELSSAMATWEACLYFAQPGIKGGSPHMCFCTGWRHSGRGSECNRHGFDMDSPSRVLMKGSYGRPKLGWDHGTIKHIPGS